jgi:RNA ligase
MLLRNLLDSSLLHSMVENRYVRYQTHPTLPYQIFNYTEKAAYENVWNDVTLKCRGLIVNFVTDEVVARPFEKFFNYGQRGAPEWSMDTLVSVADKVDGSLGILYSTPGVENGWSIATRGSFTSEQAIQATRMLHERYPNYVPTDNTTQLFEIIYPENRIVLDYGGDSELVLLGAVDNETGRWYAPHEWPNSGWWGPSAKSFGVVSLADALRMPPRENAEGLVLHRVQIETDAALNVRACGGVDSSARLKIKQDDYVALHRILTGTSARTVWQYMAVNACKDLITQPKHWGSRVGIDPKRAEQILAVGDDWPDELTRKVPDEFYSWLREKITEITLNVEWRRTCVSETLADAKLRVRTLLTEGANARDIRRLLWDALAGQDHEMRGLVMARFDDKDITTQLWKLAFPGVEIPFKKISEDTA